MLQWIKKVVAFCVHALFRKGMDYFHTQFTPNLASSIICVCFAVYLTHAHCATLYGGRKIVSLGLLWPCATVFGGFFGSDPFPRGRRGAGGLMSDLRTSPFFLGGGVTKLITCVLGGRNQRQSEIMQCTAALIVLKQKMQSYLAVWFDVQHQKKTQTGWQAGTILEKSKTKPMTKMSMSGKKATFLLRRFHPTPS